MSEITLEQLNDENVFIQFDPDCIRKRSNLSKSSDHYKFDNKEFEPTLLLNDLTNSSPKLEKLLENIEKLDKQDIENHGHYFKHFIFCDLKSNAYGAKLLASALIASGKTLGYYAKRKGEKSEKEDAPEKEKTPKVREDTPRPTFDISIKKMPKFDELDVIVEGSREDDSFEGGAKNGKPKKNKKEYQKIEFLSNHQLEQTKYQNFFLLCSNDVYDQKISVKDKKHILKTFNERPRNVHGEDVRFIVMDSGFKEGIDLFDIKYVHIFEPSVNSADQKQVIGRGTRTCGQKGLEFHPSRGWPLHVLIYDLSIPEKLRSQFIGARTAIDLYLKSLNMNLALMEFGNDLEKTLVYGAVDHDLTKPIHDFTLSDVSEDLKLGGGPKRKPIKKLAIKDVPAIVIAPLNNQEDSGVVVLPSGDKVPGWAPANMNFDELRAYVKKYYSHCSWKNVKMENMCVEKKGNSTPNSLIEYTPTQKFVQEYFTPQNPLKGMLLWHSVGTGKTCSAIASATASFVPQGYTILWVTRTTLKNDIWKNMFDMICNEQIRKMVADGMELPKDHAKRMRLLSDAWKIRPLSYKQFSNLVSKENDYYRKLVDINGPQDPLRKTLLIIDEAHKLYGGGDLSGQERPDMKALHKSLMDSYANSGKDSCRLLLMTATPITEDPMEIIKLLNLCKPREKQEITEFDGFSLNYLNEQGRFTKDGREKFLNENAGYVSFLNREKDARQFSQPIIHHIEVPLTDNLKKVEQLDKRYAKQLQDEELAPLQKELEDEQGKIDEDLRDLDRTRFFAIKDVCKDYEGKVKKACEKIANKNVKELVQEIKSITLHIKENVKKLKTQLKEKKGAFKELRKNQKEYLKTLTKEEKEKFQDGVYYMLKYHCGKKQVKNVYLTEMVKEHPHVAEIDRKLNGLNENIDKLEKGIKELSEEHKRKIKDLKDLLHQDLNALERNVVRTVLKDTQKEQRKTMKERTKETSKLIQEANTEKQKLHDSRKKIYKRVKKKVKTMRKEEKMRSKEREREAKALRKTMRKSGELREEFKGDFMKERIAHYKKETEFEFDKIKEELIREQKEKDEAKAIKEAEREEKRRVREIERERKRRIKEMEKREKERERERKRREKEVEKTRKKREKELAKKNKTKKERA